MTINSLSLLDEISWLPALTKGDWWAYGSALVVFLGVVGESIADLTPWIKSDRPRQTLAKISALALIIGLAGDIVSLHLTQIETATLNKEARQAYQQAEKTTRDAEGLRLQIAAADERAAQAQAKAAQAELDLAKYKAPRSLSPAQQATLTRALKLYPHMGVDVLTFGDTPEITSISGAILACMTQAQWDAHYATVGAGSGVAVTGVFIAVDPNGTSAAQAAGKTLVLALNSMGVGATLTSFERLQLRGAVSLFNTTVTFSSPIRVFIGSKP